MPRHVYAAYTAILCAAAVAACGPGPVPQITPLARAAREGDATTITAMAAAGQNVNGTDPGGNHWTPLLHAIHKGQVTAIDALVAAGADVNHTAPGGLTPLMMAVGNGRIDIVKRLLRAGADPHVKGDDLFEIAVSGGALSDIENPLLGSCNTEIVRTLLRRAPDLRLRRGVRGRLALLFARLNDCDEVARIAKIG